MAGGGFGTIPLPGLPGDAMMEGFKTGGNFVNQVMERKLNKEKFVFDQEMKRAANIRAQAASGRAAESHALKISQANSPFGQATKLWKMVPSATKNLLLEYNNGDIGKSILMAANISSGSSGGGGQDAATPVADANVGQLDTTAPSPDVSAPQDQAQVNVPSQGSTPINQRALQEAALTGTTGTGMVDDQTPIDTQALSAVNQNQMDVGDQPLAIPQTTEEQQIAQQVSPSQEQQSQKQEIKQNIPNATNIKLHANKPQTYAEFLANKKDKGGNIHSTYVDKATGDVVGINKDGTTTVLKKADKTPAQIEGDKLAVKKKAADDKIIQQGHKDHDNLSQAMDVLNKWKDKYPNFTGRTAKQARGKGIMGGLATKAEALSSGLSEKDYQEMTADRELFNMLMAPIIANINKTLSAGGKPSIATFQAAKDVKPGVDNQLPANITMVQQMIKDSENSLKSQGSNVTPYEKPKAKIPQFSSKAEGRLWLKSLSRAKFNELHSQGLI